MARSASAGAGAGLARILAHTLPSLILIQAFLAGRHLFGGWGITVHGVVGNITFAVALATLVLAWRARLRPAMTVAAVLVALITAQIGLGYGGRETAEAAAWHVPLGVAIFGLAVYQLTLIPRR
jgi:heme A synthase